MLTRLHAACAKLRLLPGYKSRRQTGAPYSPNLQDRALALEAEPADNLVRLYPNPASEQLVLRLRPEEAEQGGSCRILDATGQEKIALSPINGFSNILDTSQLPAGVYFVELRIGNGQLEPLSFIRL